jgi:hypothetical protein
MMPPNGMASCALIAKIEERDLNLRCIDQCRPELAGQRGLDLHQSAADGSLQHLGHSAHGASASNKCLAFGGASHDRSFPVRQRKIPAVKSDREAPALIVTLLTPEALVRAGLSPAAKVLDLKGRFRCRGCGRKGRAVVSIKLRVQGA